MKKGLGSRYIPVGQRGEVDPRTVDRQGRYSFARALIIEALDAYGKEGATHDEIVQLVGDNLETENPNRPIGISLSRMRDDELVVEVLGKWYLKENAPAEKPAAPPAYTNGARPAQVATYTGKRSAKQISVYTTPDVLDNAIGLTLVIEKRHWKMPFFGNMRICIGMEAPMWSPEQETYGNVEIVRILLQGGGVKEIAVNPKELVTIAPEE